MFRDIEDHAVEFIKCMFREKVHGESKQIHQGVRPNDKKKQFHLFRRSGNYKNLRHARYQITGIGRALLAIGILIHCIIYYASIPQRTQLADFQIFL